MYLKILSRFLKKTMMKKKNNRKSNAKCYERLNKSTPYAIKRQFSASEVIEY